VLISVRDRFTRFRDPAPQGAYNAPPADPAPLTQAQTILRGMVLNSVGSPHSRRNYAKALDDLFAFSAGP